MPATQRCSASSLARERCIEGDRSPIDRVFGTEASRAFRDWQDRASGESDFFTERLVISGKWLFVERWLGSSSRFSFSLCTRWFQTALPAPRRVERLGRGGTRQLRPRDYSRRFHRPRRLNPQPLPQPSSPCTELATGRLPCVGIPYAPTG
jgi:hypothetical protein